MATRIDLRVPQINVNDRQVGIAHWYVGPGDPVRKDDPIVDLETSKATFTLESECEGFIRPLHPEGRILTTGEILAHVYAELSDLENDPIPEEIEPTGRGPHAASASEFGFTRLSAAARAYVEARGIDTTRLAGRGLITRRLLEGEPRRSPSPGPPATSADLIGTSSPPGPLQNLRSEELSRAKRLEIQALTQGQSGGINSALTVRFHSAPLRDYLEEQGLLNGQVLPIILYETAQLLRKFPRLNAFYHDGKIHYYDAVHIGIALDLGTGLLVPVIRDADQQVPADLQTAVVEAALKYGRKKLTADDLSEGTFTLTDLTSQNIEQFHPLINAYQSAILGIGGDASADGFPMTFTIAFDHRVLTGLEVAQFLKELRKRTLTYAALGEIQQ